MHEFTAAPVAVAASLTESTDPFGPSFPETIPVSGIHPTLGLDLHYDTESHRCQITKIDPGTLSHRIPQWRSHICHAFVLSIDQTPVHTIDFTLQEIAKARQLDNKNVVVSLIKDDAPNCLSEVGLPQLYFDQLWVMKRHISHTALAVIHNAITGPKFNHRHLQQQLNWKE
jgi:hypothetical protein